MNNIEINIGIINSIRILNPSEIKIEEYKKIEQIVGIINLKMLKSFLL